MKNIFTNTLLLLILGFALVPYVLGAVPVISNPTPQSGDMAIQLNPVVSANITNPNSNPMTIIFSVKVNNVWTVVKTYNNALSGNYSSPTTPFMNQPYTNYTWKITATDGADTTEQNFTLTTRGLLQLKYTVNIGASTSKGERQIMPLMGDINNDGTQDIVTAAGPNIIAINGKTGAIEWTVPGAEGVAIELSDLDGDGTPEVLAVRATENLGIMAINGNGTIRWQTKINKGLHFPMFPILTYDFDGDGHPTIYVASNDAEPDPYPSNPTVGGADYNNTLNGTDPDYKGSITVLDWQGNILDDTWIMKPCWGGLSLADPNFDGNFQMYLSDRRDQYHNIPARGLQAYNPITLDLLWNRPDIQHSSPMAVVYDVYNTGKLNVIATQITLRGSLVLNTDDGSSIADYQNKGLPSHTTPTVYDIDGDGHPEFLYGTSYPSNAPKNFAVFDPITGQTDFQTTLESHTTWPPKVGDVTGDGKMEILVALGEQMDYWSNFPLLVYDSNYKLIDRVEFSGNGQLSPARIFDVDSDGKNEVVIGSANGKLYVFDTPGITSTPAPNTWLQEYSLYRTGAPVYFDSPGPKAPFITHPTPVNDTVNINANPKVSVNAIDFQKDKFTLTFQIYQGFTWKTIGTFVNVSNGNYTANTSPYVTSPSTNYKWRVIATDVKSNSKTYEFTFTTTSSINTTKPVVTEIYPISDQDAVPITTTALVFNISDTDSMTYTGTTIPNIGSASASNVPSGQYTIPVSGLQYNTDYTWRLEVAGGSDITYKELYFSTPYILNIINQGPGSVNTNPSAPFAKNTLVNLTAVPSLGNTFLGWGQQLSGYDPLASITMNTPHSVTARFRQETGSLLVDSDFSESLTSQELIDNPTYQDWYESRNDGAFNALISLDESNIGANTGKKAKLTGSISGNAYLTQDFLHPVNDSFSLQWDVYVDNIINSALYTDRAAMMMVGDNTPFSSRGPNYQAARNFVWLGFYKDGGAETGAANLVTTENNGTERVLATGVTLDTWHNIKVIGNLITDKYDVYLDDSLVGSAITARTNKTSVTHISFGQWNDAAGTFYIDNVMEITTPVNVTCVDNDLDGYNSTGASCGPVDCNDANIAIHPNAIETCDGIDNDCNIATIDGSGVAAPSNTKQLGVCLGSIQICSAGSFVDNYASVANYQVTENSCDNLDNNCNGAIDESLTKPSINQQGLCVSNIDVCSAGIWSASVSNYLPVSEICANGLDENCNGISDDGCSALNLAGWNYRKKITIDHTKVNSDIAGFPVLVSLIDTDLASKAQADGDDIVFTAADGSTKLNHEIESYDSGNLVAWINTDVSSVTDTVLYMYYGNSTVASQQNTAAVWDSGYKTVYALDEVTGNAIDSTSNAITGTVLNGLLQNQAGKIGKAYQFDGVNDRILLPQIFSGSTSFTVASWITPASKQGYVFSQRDLSSKGVLMQYYPLENNFQLYVNNALLKVSASANQWHYVVATYDGATARLYVDGLTPVSSSATLVWPNISTVIGDRTQADRTFQGKMDDIKISTVARSQAYIRTSFNNQNSPATFYNVGGEEN